MNENLLSRLLSNAVKRGDIRLEVNDSIADLLLEQTGGELADEAKLNVRRKLKRKLQDAAIAHAKKDVSVSLPFGRFIESVRNRAGLSRAAIGERISKNDEYIVRLERGDLVPTQVPPSELANIVETFNIPLTSLREMVVATINTSASKASFRAVARSHGGVRHDLRTEDVERALDAFARKMQQSSKQSQSLPELEVYLSRVRAELESRGRTDLLV